MSTSTILDGKTNLRWVHGAQAILRVVPALQESFRGWGQDVALSQIPHSLSVPTSPSRIPTLLVFSRSGDDQSTNVVGAVLVFAYGGWLFQQQLLTNADRLGHVGVFGDPIDRMALALLAVHAMLTGGAALARLDFTLDREMSEAETDLVLLQARSALVRLSPPLLSSRFSVRVLARVRPFELLLSPDLDGTLAVLGRRTRRNIRAARRKCELDLGCTFARHAVLSLPEFLNFNKSCWHKTSQRVARWRYFTAIAHPGFLSGLRTANGEWMCLSGGRLVGKTAIIDWQMNSPAFVSYSLSLTMRSYLMEAFGRDGMRSLYFEGGTSHVMAEHFAKRTVFQIEARSPHLWLKALEWCLRTWLPHRALTRSLFGARSRGR